MDKCALCGKTVYFAEKARALDKTWHKMCLKCTSCKKSLLGGNLVDHDSKPYCKHCYDNQFRIKGYGAGQGGLSSYQK